jgi:hypothetical protein
MITSRGNIQLDNEAIIARCYDFLKNHKLQDIVRPGELNPNYGKLGGKLSSVVMSMYLRRNKLEHLMPQHWEEFKPLIDIIKQQSGKESIINGWFNILPTNTGLEAHTHSETKKIGTTYGSFVYYPKLEEDYNPIELLINNEWIPITAQTGDWICFNLDCIHKVPVNTTDRHRISFTFDL